MIRKTLTILSLIGLQLSVGLWGASHFGFGYSVGTESFTFRSGGVEWSSLSAKQHDLLDKQALANWKLSVHSYWYRVGAAGRLETHWLPSRKQRLGSRIKLYVRRSSWANRYASGNRYTRLRYDDQYIPFWIPAAFFAVTFLWSFIPVLRRRKRKKLGLCLKCGYDLRGSKDRCPECGTAFERE